jgi:hypothetical protein
MKIKIFTRLINLTPIGINPIFLPLKCKIKKTLLYEIKFNKTHPNKAICDLEKYKYTSKLNLLLIFSNLDNTKFFII